MPLTEDEKQHILEAETLKEEIRKCLPPEKKESDLGKQLVLLIVGFLLTGVIGEWLTDHWKSKQADEQRQYLEDQRALDRRYGLITQLSKEVASMTAATDDVLASYEEGWTQKDMDERLKNWMQNSRAWRVNSQVLRAEIGSSFSDSEITKTVDLIMDDRRSIGRAIVDLPRNRKRLGSDPNLNKEIDDTRCKNNEIKDLLAACVARMTAQVNRAPSPKAGNGN